MRDARAGEDHHNWQRNKKYIEKYRKTHLYPEGGGEFPKFFMTLNIFFSFKWRISRKSSLLVVNWKFGILVILDGICFCTREWRSLKCASVPEEDKGKLIAEISNFGIMNSHFSSSSLLHSQSHDWFRFFCWFPIKIRSHSQQCRIAFTPRNESNFSRLLIFFLFLLFTYIIRNTKTTAGGFAK